MSRRRSGPPALLALGVVLSACAPPPRAAPLPSRQKEEALRLPGHRWRRIRYLQFVPKSAEGTTERWPLILFLHGAGERGNDLRDVEREGLPWLLKDRNEFPFLVVAPQCPFPEEWSLVALDALLDHVLTTLPVDRSRIYATGLSAGGAAALDLAAARPGRIAAVVAVSINRGPSNPCRLRSVPVWIIHNRGDERIPWRRASRVARELEGCGGEVRLTIRPEEGHDAWTRAYGERAIYDWLLEHRSPDPVDSSRNGLAHGSANGATLTGYREPAT